MAMGTPYNMTLTKTKMKAKNMTYIYEELNTNQVADALRRDEYAGWSYDGAKALAEWLEGLAEDTGEPYELDTVALRCEFSEYDDAADACQNYDEAPDESEYNDEEEHEAACLEWLQDNTAVIEFNGGLIVRDF